MIAVGWSGGIYALNSYDGSTSYIGSGTSGQNAMARDDQGVLWATQRIGTQYSLTTVDPTTGAATVVWPSVDYRGLTNAGGGMLYGIEEASPDTLVLIDTTTGLSTAIGSLGYGGVQALTMMNGQLFAWDVNSELLLVDAATGAATDVNPIYSGIGGGVQWLARRGDGRLVGGHTTLYEIDPNTGVATLIGGALSGLRGAEPWQQSISHFGTGCYQVTSQATINPGANPTLSLSSNNHQPNAPGLVIFGISSTSTSGVPLPLSIDPIFGTIGCTLYVSLDVSLLAITTASSPATLDLQVPILPGWEGQALLVQHAVLANVPGGVSLSDATVVQFGY